MFRKLIKYEWTATMRAMLPVYMALLLLSLVNSLMYALTRRGGGGFSQSLQLVSFLQVTAALLYFAVLVGMAVFAAVVVIQRFYKGLLRQEGYLMFTLPVKTWELVFSKACVALLVGMISMFVGACSVGILGGMDFLRGLITLPKDLFFLLWEAFNRNSAAVGEMLLYGVEGVAAVLASFFAGLYQLYASMALGHLSQNHKILFSILWYVGLRTGLRILSFTLVQFGISSNFSWLGSMQLQSAFHLILIGIIVVNLLILAVFWWLTNSILEKKLNLE